MFCLRCMCVNKKKVALDDNNHLNQGPFDLKERCLFALDVGINPSSDSKIPKFTFLV